MDSIILLTIIAAVILGIWRVVEKFIGLHIHPILGAIFLYLAGFIAATAAFLIVRPEITINPPFKKGVIVAILAGIMIVFCDVLILYIFKKGGNISMITSFLSAGSIVVALILGTLLFRESLSVIQIFAIAIIVLGLFLLTR